MNVSRRLFRYFALSLIGASLVATVLPAAHAAELAIASVERIGRGPLSLGDELRVRVRVRNDSEDHATVSVAAVDPAVGVRAIRAPHAVRVLSGRTASATLQVPVRRQTVRRGDFASRELRLTVFLADPAIEGDNPLAIAWRDDEASDNAMTASFDVEPFAFLRPEVTGAVRVWTHHDSAAPDTFCLKVATRGLLDTYWDEFDLPVGYSNAEDARRPRCREADDHQYISYARFDLDSLVPSTTFVDGGTVFELSSAELRWEEHDRVVVNTERCELSTVSVGHLAERFVPGKITGEQSALRSKPESDEIIQVGTASSVDLSDWVRSWLSNTIPNHGVSFRGEDRLDRKENKACVADLRDIELKVEFSRR